MTQSREEPVAVRRRFKSYPAYKDSGVEWLGNIPAPWEVKRLKFLAPFSTEKLLQKPDDLPYIGLEHVEAETGRLLLDSPVEDVDSSVGRFEPGDTSGRKGDILHFRKHNCSDHYDEVKTTVTKRASQRGEKTGRRPFLDTRRDREAERVPHGAYLRRRDRQDRRAGRGQA